MHVPGDCNIFLIYVCNLSCYRKKKALVPNVSNIFKYMLFIKRKKSSSRDAIDIRILEHFDFKTHKDF